MDKRQSIILLKFCTAKLREVHKDLQAFQMAFATLKITLEREYPGFSDLADASLAAAIQSPALEESIRKQFDEPQEKFLQRVEQAQTEEEVEKLLLRMPKSKFEN